MKPDRKIALDRPVYSIEDTIRLLGISRTSIHRARVQNLLKFRKLMGRVVIRRDDLEDFINSLPEAEVEVET